jgi:FkbM family methyltransferase
MLQDNKRSCLRSGSYEVFNGLSGNLLIRSIGLPILKAFNRDISIRHHWLNRKVKLNLFTHKGYWYHGRRREAKEMNAISAMVSFGETVVEVGGHIGYISLWLAECVGRCSNGNVTVFEPGSNNLPYIRQNVSGIDHIKLIEKGCGSTNGTLEFFEDSLTGQNNSFVESFGGLQSNINAAPNVDIKINKRVVDVVRLDTELSYVSPDFIKIDVEGYELQVLLGTDGWYRKAQKLPIIMIEVQADYNEIGTWMNERNYTLFDIHGNEISVIPHSTLNLFALNLEQHAVQLARWKSQRS